MILTFINAAIGSLAGVFISALVLLGRNGFHKKDAVQIAIKAITKDSFFRYCHFILQQGYRTEAEDENLESLWHAYSGLGLNGRGKSKYEECKKLPLIIE